MARNDPFEPFTAVDRVKYAEVAEKSRELAAQAAQDRVATWMERAQETCESPMEELFAVAIAPWTLFPMIYVESQVEFDNYRVDFLVSFFGIEDGEEYQLVVEVDGHDFHEKTKEQAERDKKRDRYFTVHGTPVMRFTGREIFRDAHACVWEAMTFLRDLAAVREDA